MIDSHVTVSNESGIPCDEGSLARLAAYLMAELSLHPSCELGITLVDAERMSTLHEDWMNEPVPPDVLSFPIDEITTAALGEEPVRYPAISSCSAYPAASRRPVGASTRKCSSSRPTGCALIGHDHQPPESYEAMPARTTSLPAGGRHV